MKKLIALLLILVTFSGCYYNNYIMVKPYTITSKKPYHYTYQGVSYKTTEYTYQDSVGQINYFYDSDTLFWVGDIIH